MTLAEPVDQYLRTFSWNKVKYRADKSLGELIDMLQKVGFFLLSVLFRLLMHGRKLPASTTTFEGNTPNTTRSRTTWRYSSVSRRELLSLLVSSTYRD